METTKTKLLSGTMIGIFFSLFAFYSLISEISTTNYIVPSLQAVNKNALTQRSTTTPTDFEKSNKITQKHHVRTQSSNTNSASENDDKASTATTSAKRGKKLEFVHISKTGGSAVENLAGKHGIAWGACHYKENKGLGCSNPDIPWPYDSRSYTFNNPWHTPPKIIMRMFNSTYHPFFENNSSSSNNNNSTTVVDLFAVVRNPYTRMVSEFYCPMNGNRDKDKRNNATAMNEWIINQLTTLSHENTRYRDLLEHPEEFNKRDPKTRDPPVFRDKHFINCAEYVFDNDGQQIVQHVIHYENLKEEFDPLMKEYSLNITMPRKEDSRVNKRRSTSQLTYLDLSPEAIAVINNFAKEDFETFGYTMVTQFQKDENYSEFAAPPAAATTSTAL